MQENQEIIQKELSNDKSKISIQLKLKINFKSDLNKINILQNNRIGIIYNNILIIYSLYNFLEISRIIPEFPKNEKRNENGKDKNGPQKDEEEKNEGGDDDNEDRNELEDLKNFIELKNKDLVLWTSRIILFYSLYEKNYKLYQTIDEFNEKKFPDFYVDNIIELENGNLVVCSYQGLKLYAKTKTQYCFQYYYSTNYPIIDSLGIKSNRLILFKSKLEVFDFLCADIFYEISIFNTYNQFETTLINKSFHNYLNRNFDFIINGDNLFVLYAEDLEIFNLTNHKKIFDKHTRNPRHAKTQFFINKILCNYSEDYLIGGDDKEIKLYKFEENNIKSYKELEFGKFEITGIKKLKKDNFLIYNKNNILFFIIK